MRFNNKYILFFFLLVFCLLWGLEYLKTRELKKDYIIGYCEIVYWKSGNRFNPGNIKIGFKYTANDKEYEEETQYDSDVFSPSIWKEHFIGKKMPIAYYRKKPILSRPLIIPNDFSQFNLPYPDSLIWVKELMYLEKKWKQR